MPQCRSAFVLVVRGFDGEDRMVVSCRGLERAGENNKRASISQNLSQMLHKVNHISGFRIHWFSRSGDPFETVSVPV
jgi:hypothetical protein